VTTRVTPTRRLAHYLRARHDEHCMAQGLAVWTTPDIVTWDELVERAFLLDRQAGRLTGRWLSAQASRLVWERLVREDPETAGILTPSGVAATAWKSWCRAQDYGLPLPPPADTAVPEYQAFSRWCRRYLEWLEAGDWIDPRMAQHRVRAASIGPQLELVGFDRLTPAQEAATGRWAAAGVDVRRAVIGGIGSEVGWVRCLDAAAEVEAATRWAVDLLDRGLAQRIAIIVPDLARRRAEVRRIVDRVVQPGSGLTGGAAPQASAYELAAAPPLIEQPAVAAAIDLLELALGRPDLVAISRYLRNPFVAGADTEGSARARLDARIRRFEGPGFGLPALRRLADQRDCPLLAGQLDSAAQLTSNLPEKTFPSIWTKSLFELLDALGWPGSRLDSREQQAQQRFRGLVAEFGSLDEFSGRIRRAEAVGLLRDLAERIQFEPQTVEAPLLVIDAETMTGMRFDAAWVCGMESSRWPAPANPDPFLPLHLQVRLELPGACAALAEREAREAIERLASCAPRVLLSVPQMDGDTPLLPSPLLERFPEASVSGGWAEPLLAAALFAGRPALESWSDTVAPALGDGERGRGGARLLELQAACPFRAQAELRLGARVLEEPGLGLDAADRGQLIHEVLAILWRELGSQQTLLALDEVTARSAVQRAVEQALERPRRSADPVQAELLELEARWLEDRAIEMLALDRARTPFQIASIESPVVAHIGELELELRPDRIDRLGDGSLGVIDYKTGSRAEVRAWLDERPRLPQLPAYVQAIGPTSVGAVSFARIRKGDTRYEGMARNAEAFPGLRVPGARGGPRGVDSWDQALAEWRRRLESLASEFARGELRLAPDPPRACEHCHLGALCRIAEAQPEAAGEGGGDE
jgi:ATP-dependent helicase/nuclease subunit B